MTNSMSLGSMLLASIWNDNPEHNITVYLNMAEYMWVYISKSYIVLQTVPLHPNK